MVTMLAAVAGATQIGLDWALAPQIWPQFVATASASARRTAPPSARHTECHTTAGGRCTRSAHRSTRRELRLLASDDALIWRAFTTATEAEHLGRS